MAGVFIRRFFSGRIRTNNVLYLLLLAGGGVFLLLFAGLAVSEAWNGNPLPWQAWLYVAAGSITGVIAWINVVKNVIRMRNSR